ncbi:MAG TPA: peptidase [Gemmatimonadota bacterium]|jgi:predicted metalloprotease with PDZ domain|nr:peptidase [Gemmatimonadota bacterium]
MPSGIARPRWSWILIASVLGTAPLGAQPATDDAPVLQYRIDLNRRAGDRFHASLSADGLAVENAVLQFASTAPGTYQVMDIGRFVDSLHATDADGREIAVERLSTNQWRISDPARVQEVAWTVADTWDAAVQENPVYPMAGTSIEDDHVLFNAHAVLPFPAGLQDAPVELALVVPEGWTVGTALEKGPDGDFVAEDYDFLVDSPILAGNLTVATTQVAGVPIEIYTYSAGRGIRSDQLLGAMDSMLEAAGDFLGGLPVDRYVFLYHFEGAPRPGAAYGAWEHSYSSEYVFPEVPFSEAFGQTLKDVAAHEFLHIVTPLNIHSEIIERFDFETPVPSRHLWLYEGVTEWGAHAAQLRGGIKTPEATLEETARKIAIDRAQFDPAYSLEKLALTSYTPEGQAQYGNIYQRGAVVAGLLDIRLLELSDGRRGLQELLLELMERYGKSRPFQDEELYDVLVEMTDPAIGEFFDSYVQGADPLPIAEYYDKLGIDFIDDPEQPRFRIRPDPTPEQARLRAAWLGERAAA